MAHSTRILRRFGIAVLVLVALVVPMMASNPVTANGGDRTLWLHHTHTGETARFTFRKNGQYDQSVLSAMNRFLADWRTKEPTRMDPALVDLIWQIYQQVGATQPVNIVSSYRTPQTNANLRKTSMGVAENSQHMRGKAMDIYIPGVPLAKLREAAMRYQVGGVGYYPTSGSPFVHVDTGNVRAWPRMTRAQLKKIFPDGKTLHLPSDGKPLSEPGRVFAMAEWSRCHTVPCTGNLPPLADNVLVAAVDGAAIAPRPAAREAIGDDPAQRLVATTTVTAPIPLYRPGRTLVAALPGSLDSARLAPIPATRPSGLRTASRMLEGAVPTEAADGTLITAYAPEVGDLDPLAALIDGAADDSLSDEPGLVTRFFEGTFTALADPQTLMADALDHHIRSNGLASALALRAGIDFIAPDMDHVNETLVVPQPITAAFWADLTEAEGYLDKTTELGANTVLMHLVKADAAIPAYDRFIGGRLIAVADL